MNLVLGIVFGSVAMGLFVKRWRFLHSVALGIWICLLVAYSYLKSRL